jgi:hypothetical protein
LERTFLGEEDFRALLDERGVLRSGSLPPPPSSSSYLVFAQRDDARLDIAALQSHAKRFFGVKLGLTVTKHYTTDAVEVDAARFVVAEADGTPLGTRLCYGRRTEPDDLTAAEMAERRQGTYGMALLAQRCPMVWLVTRESSEDRAALTIATVFASVLLGPILASPHDAPTGQEELFGVRTARTKLEGRGSPYR